MVKVPQGKKTPFRSLRRMLGLRVAKDVKGRKRTQGERSRFGFLGAPGQKDCSPVWKRESPNSRGKNYRSVLDQVVRVSLNGNNSVAFCQIQNTASAFFVFRPMDSSSQSQRKKEPDVQLTLLYFVIKLYILTDFLFQWYLQQFQQFSVQKFLISHSRTILSNLLV